MFSDHLHHWTILLFVWLMLTYKTLSIFLVIFANITYSKLVTITLKFHKKNLFANLSYWNYLLLWTLILLILTRLCDQNSVLFLFSKTIFVPFFNYPRYVFPVTVAFQSFHTRICQNCNDLAVSGNTWSPIV